MVSFLQELTGKETLGSQTLSHFDNLLYFM